MAAVASSSGAPSGEYAERILEKAWPETPPLVVSEQHNAWLQRRDFLRDMHAAYINNAQQQREYMPSGVGFEAMHASNAEVARHIALEAELADLAAASLSDAHDDLVSMRQWMIDQVCCAERTIDTIKADPSLSPAARNAAIENFVELLHGEMVAANATVTAALTAQAATVVAAIEALPWPTVWANSAPAAGPPAHKSPPSLIHAAGLHTPLPLEPAPTPAPGPPPPAESRVPGSDLPPPATKPPPPQTRKPGNNLPPPAEKPPPTLGKVPGSDLPPSAATDLPPVLGQGTGTTPGFVVPPSTGGSALGSGGGLGSGGFRPGGFASPPQGLLPSQGFVPPQGLMAPPISSAASAGPLSSPAGLTGGGVPRAAPPVLPVTAAPASTQSVPAAAASQPGMTAVSPAAMPAASPPPQAAAAPAGPLAPAPALTTPPSPATPGPSTVVPPAPPPAPPSTPFHGPLPLGGTPQITRQGTVEPAEDPDIVRARQLLWECLWHGRRYPNLQWAFGLHREDQSATTFYLTSSEGFPYIPRHVHLPDTPGLVTVFDDHQCVPVNRAVMLAGWANPARIIAAHQRLRADAGRPTLWAIVSTMPLDAAGRMELAAGVRLVDVEPQLERNPLYDPAKSLDVPGLAVGRRHRLAVVDRRLWQRIEPVRRRWQAALDLVEIAADVTRERAVFTGLVAKGAVVGTSDPHAGLLDQVLKQLGRRELPEADMVRALRTVGYMGAVLAAQAARRTPQDLTDDTGYVDAYRRARAWEAASILVEAVGAHGNGTLAPNVLADIAYCAVTAHPPGQGDDTVAEVLSYYTS